MSIRTGLLPQLFRTHQSLARTPYKRLFHFLPHHSEARTPPPNPFRSRPPEALALSRKQLSRPPASRTNIRFLASLGLGLTLAYSLAPTRTLHCDAAIARQPEFGGGNPPAQSILSVYELGFGTVCGICTGVFVKKGLRAIAFVLGGLFVLLQVSIRLPGRTLCPRLDRMSLDGG